MHLDEVAEKLYKEHKWSKAIKEQREKEKILFGLRRYEQAQLAKMEAERMERIEIE